MTAMEVFGVSEDKVTQEMRSKAKAINTKLLYGIGREKLLQKLRAKLSADSHENANCDMRAIELRLLAQYTQKKDQNDI